MNTNNSWIPNVAVVTFAAVLAGIVAALCVIVIRDGNSALVSQAMQELVYIAGVAVVALGALLGLSKFVDAKSLAATGASANTSSETSSETSGVGDMAALLQAVQQSPQGPQSQPTPTSVAPVAGQ